MDVCYGNAMPRLHINFFFLTLASPCPENLFSLRRSNTDSVTLVCTVGSMFSLVGMRSRTFSLFSGKIPAFLKPLLRFAPPFSDKASINDFKRRGKSDLAMVLFDPLNL